MENHNSKTYHLLFYQVWFYILGMIFSIAQLTLLPAFFVFVFPVFSNEAFNGFLGLILGVVIFFLLSKIFIHKAEVTFRPEGIHIKPLSKIFVGNKNEIFINKNNIKSYTLQRNRSMYQFSLKAIEPKLHYIFYLNSKTYPEINEILHQFIPEKEKK